jgi:hypothetical protein
MVAMALTPVGLTYNTLTVSAQEASTDTSEATITVTPVPGEVKSLQTFTVTLPGTTASLPATKQISSGKAAAITLLDAEGETYAILSGTAEGNVLTLTTGSEVIYPGKYTLSLPVKSYTLDGALNTIASSFEYTVAERTELSYSSSVVSGSIFSASSFKGITLTFNDAATLNDGKYEASIQVWDADTEEWGEDYDAQFFQEAFTDGDKVFTFVPRETKTPANGKYRLYVPATVFLTADGEKANREISIEFTIADAPAVTINPAAGEVESLETFSLTFADATTAAFNYSAFSNRLFPTVAGTNGTAATSSMLTTGISAEGNVLTFKVGKLESAGTYTLTVPGQCYTLDDKDGVTLTFTYTIVAADYATVTPAAGEYASLQEFKVTINNATTVEFNVDAFRNGKLPKLVGINGTTASGSMAASGYSAEGNVLTFKIGYSEFTTVGEYELQIPGECFTVDGEAGKDITYGTYKIIASDNTFEYSIDPKDGATITSFSSVVVRFPNAASITIDEDAEEPVTLETYNAEYFDWDIVDTQASVAGNELAITVPSYVTLASGKYNLTINANYISVDGQKFTEKIESSFTLEQAVPEFSTVIDPAEGTVNSLKEFNIIFKDVDTFAANNYAADTKYYIVDSENNKTYSTESYINYDAEGSPLYIAFNEITTPGTYKLVLPANSYKVNGILGNELTFTYTVAAAVDKTAYTVTINGEELKDGAELTEYSTITVTFPNATELSYDENDWTYYPMVQSWDESWQEWGDAYGMTATIDGNSISFDVESWAGKLEGGTYRVYIPADNFSIDGESLAADIVVNFTIKQVVPEFTATSAPEDGSKVVSLSVINIFFDGVSTIGKGYDATPYILDANNIKTSADAYQVTAIFSDDDNFKYALHFELDSEITEEGTYTLVLPAGSYIVDGVKGDKDLSFTYTVDKNAAVNAIFVDGVQNVDVYDLRGIRVLKNATPAQVRNLDTNIYIINGQKIRLRK